MIVLKLDKTSFSGSFKQMTSGIKYIVFDFDGTLVDTYDSVKKVVGEDLFNRRKVSEKLTFKSLIKRSILRSLLFPGVRYFILGKVNYSEVDLFEGIKEEIKILSLKYEVGIVSNNKKSNVLKVLEREGLIEFFSFIHSGGFIFGKDVMLKKICRKNSLQPKEVIYIGDEESDIAFARKAGVGSIAVTWGYDGRGRLERKKPDHLIDKPYELSDVVVGFWR